MEGRRTTIYTNSENNKGTFGPDDRKDSLSAQDFALIFAAARLASRKHKTKNRKGTDDPYISHPMSVAIILAEFAASAKAIIAGILHDTVEDSDLTLAEVKDQFGVRVAEIVAACSEPDKSLPWEERKEHTIKSLDTADAEVWMVTCADKYHNVANMLADYELEGDQLWSRFRRGKEQQHWYYQELTKALAPGRHFCPALYQQLQAAVDRLFAGD